MPLSTWRKTTPQLKLYLKIGRVWKLSMLMDSSKYIKLSNLKTKTSKRISHLSLTHCLLCAFDQRPKHLHFEKLKSADYNSGLLVDCGKRTIKKFHIHRRHVERARQYRSKLCTSYANEKQNFTRMIEFDESSTVQNFFNKKDKKRLIYPKEKNDIGTPEYEKKTNLKIRNKILHATPTLRPPK